MSRQESASAVAAAASQNANVQSVEQVEETQSVEQVEETQDPNAIASSVRRLVKPGSGNLLGTVSKVSFRSADLASGGKFKRDTYICVIEDITTDKLHNVFITTRQWAEYGCAEIMFEGNIVNVGIEHCIEGVTGYLEHSDDVEMTAHEHTFDAFTQSLPMSEIAIMKQLSKSGLSDGLITSITASIVRQRIAKQKAPGTSAREVSFLG